MADVNRTNVMKAKDLIISLFLSGVATIILLLFEMRSVPDEAFFSMNILFAFAVQFAFFTIVFMELFWYIPLMNSQNRSKNKMLALEKTGLGVQMVSVVFLLMSLISPSNALLVKPIVVALLCVLFVGGGLWLKYKKRNQFAIPFISWGIALCLYCYFFSFAGFVV
jgi:hypothetical protein